MQPRIVILLSAWLLGWLTLPLWVIVGTLVVCLCLYLWPHKRSVHWLLAGLLLLLGQILQATREHSILPQFLEGRDLDLIGCVTQVERLERGLRLWLTDNRLSQTSQPDRQASPMAHYFNADLQLSYFDYGTAAAQLPEIDVGYWLSVQVRLKQPRAYGNPQSFDYRAWALRHGIGARGVIKQWQPMEKQACLTEPQRWLATAREQLANAIDNRPLSVTSKALWQALTLGERRGLEQHHWQVLNATGTSHLLVISGLHIGLVALGSYGLVLALARRLGCQSWVGLRLAALAACLVGLIYTALADFAIPTQRAMIMLVCFLWGVLWGLEIGFIRRLGLAFLLTVATQPESIFSLGLWLSYGAVMVLGLSWVASGKQRLRQRLQALLRAQLALTLLVAPITGFTTGHVSLVAPLINIWLVPVFSICILPVVLLFSLLDLVLGLPHWGYNLLNGLLESLWALLQTVAAWPWSAVQWVPLNGWQLAALLLLSGLLLLLRYWPPLLLVLALPLLWPQGLLSSWLAQHNSQYDTVSITLFDVGQGLSVWIAQADKHILYDLGDRFASGFNLVDAVVLPELRAAGVKRLARIYISHWDRDHSGGLLPLLAQMPVDLMILPDRLPGSGWLQQSAGAARWDICGHGQWQTVGVVKLRSWQLTGSKWHGNNRSCVVQIEVWGQRLLLPGDILRAGEQALVRRLGVSLNSDILLAPHHGSNSSSGPALLHSVQPRLVLIANGYRNRYGHPHPSVLAAYDAGGADWRSTARHGQIRLIIQPDGTWKIETQSR